jgi:hypothetical protein
VIARRDTTATAEEKQNRSPPKEKERRETLRHSRTPALRHSKTISAQKALLLLPIWELVDAVLCDAPFSWQINSANLSH